MQICNSSLGGFSVVKHLYSLEMALYCYKALWRNILDFWSRFKTKNLRKLHILRLHARSVICIKNRHIIPKRAIRPSQSSSNFTASQIDQSDALSLFQPTNNERAWSRVPQSSSRRLSCAKEKSSGVENVKPAISREQTRILISFFCCVVSSIRGRRRVP